MAHTWTDEELTKFYEGVNVALKKLLRKINAVDADKVGTAELLEQLSLQSAEVTVTASDNGIETTVSDLAGRLSSIEQTTDSITLRVTNAEASASEAAASAQNAESTITQTAEKIELRVQSAETAANDAATSASNAESAAGNAADSASDAAASAKTAESAITQMADKIELRVQGAESSASNAQTVADSAKSTADSAKSTADSAASSASEALQTAESAVSTITQLADSIALSVKNGSQTATITLSVNGETQTGTIDLSGLVTFSDLSTEGKTTICGGNIDTTSLFAKDITVSSVSLVGSGRNIPTFSLSGSYSKLTVSSQTGSYANGVGIVNVTCADSNDLHIKTGGAIVLEAGGYLNGGTGYSDVAILGQITEASWAGETIDVSHGGTGATTAATARTNLGVISGTWTPTLYGVTVSSYSRRNGWYLKVGNTVTVGFDLNLSLSADKSSTQLIVSGLPYTPSSNVYAGGGGECSGYYGEADVLFQGWRIVGGSKYIYGRGCTCNSSAGFRYSTNLYCGGKSGMLLSGTITYKTSS